MQIPYYETLGDVYVSHYSDEDTPSFLNAKLIQNSPELPAGAWNGQNVYYQCMSTLAGLNAAIRHGEETGEQYDIAIKLRSDQSFGNLTPIINAVKSNPDKYTCSNLHFRPDHISKFHASDKLIGAGIFRLRDCFRTALRRCMAMPMHLSSGLYEIPAIHPTSPPYAYDTSCCIDPTYGHSSVPPFAESDKEPPVLGRPRKLAHNYDGVYPEVLIATSWLMAQGIMPNRFFSRAQMKKHFQIVKVEDMLPYVNKYANGMIEHNWLEIDHIDQL